MALQLAAIFREHMVLQQGKPIAVFGTGEPGHLIRVSIATVKGKTCVRKDGSWRLFLQPLSAEVGATLRVSDGVETVTVSDVAIGEVWLAAGQSNMELPLSESENGVELAKQYQGDRIRFYQTPKCAVTGAPLEQAEQNTAWKIASPENVGNLSAVAFHFAQERQKQTQCVIGIVACNWGGTSVACWMSRERLLSTAAGQHQMQEYTNLVGDKTAQQYEAEMQAYQNRYQAWKDKVDRHRRENPEVTWETLHRLYGDCPWPQPVGWQSPFCPNNLYRSMVRRVAPFSLQGVLYYQGEEDVVRYAGYCDLLTILVKQWRDDWNDSELPFLLVQLPMYLAAGETDDMKWAFLREQQAQAVALLRNTGLVSLTDCGEWDNIHPMDKKTPGVRLAKLARQMLSQVQEAPTTVPRFAYTDSEGAIILQFSETEPLQLHRAEPTAFQVADADGNFHAAQAEQIAPCQLRITCSEVPFPTAVRYAWYNYGAATVFTQSGMAISSFERSL